jgi:coenzyme F420-reducing hydrogenase beta subunit
VKNKKELILATKETCTGCLACVDACNYNALTGHLDKDGHYYPKINRDKCVQCGLCTKTCPVINKFNYKSSPDISSPFAAWANNDDIRMKSASGGVFAAIAEYIINDGGYVVGAAMQGLTVKHIMIDTIDDIKLLQGSKYQQSYSAGIYKKTYEELKLGKTVLFSGLPCQIAGLLSFLKNKKYNGLLYTADLICSGVPSQLTTETYCKHNNYKIKTLLYTTKYEGWKNSKRLTVIYNDNSNTTLIESKKNLIYSAFLGAATNRYSCYDCPYTVHNRKSDLTLADFWGLKDYPEEHFKGVSLVITHSEKGKHLLAESDTTIHKTSWKKCVPYNPRLVYGKRPFAKHRIVRRKMSYLFKRLNYNTLMKIYAGNIGKKDILWWPYKISKYIIYKISQQIKNKYIHNYLKKQIK